MKRRIKINGTIIFFVMALIGLFPNYFFRYRSPGPLEFLTVALGIAAILLGQLIRVSARGFKSEHSDNGHSLIQNGPYALVRNPMYLGILLIGLGVVLVLFKWWAACVFLLVFILRYMTLVAKEEEKLLAAFPKDYPDYRKRSPLLFPDPRLLFKEEPSVYLPLKLPWLKKEIRSILPILLGVLFIRLWLDIARRGLAFYLEEVVLWLGIILIFTGASFYLNRKTLEREKQCLT